MMKYRGRVRWDEANLDAISKNKPLRRKIDEPKTPYHPMLEEDVSYAAHAEAVRLALNKVALNEKRSMQFGVRTSSDDAACTGDKQEGSGKETRAMEFEEGRRAHYDEFKKVKEVQQKGSFLDDDDEYYNHERSCNSSPSLNIGIREIHIDGDDEILKTINIEGDS